MASALPSWVVGEGLLSHGELISHSLPIVRWARIVGQGVRHIHGLLGLKNAPNNTSRAWREWGMRGCRVSLTVTPFLLPSTQWDQTHCLELLSLWKENRMLTQLTTTFSVLKKVQQLLTKIQKSITFRKWNYQLIKCLTGTPRFWCFLHSSHHSSNPNKAKSVLTPFSSFTAA